MTRSYPSHLDADYTPNDIGPPEKLHYLHLKQEYEDGLMDEIRWAEKFAETNKKYEQLGLNKLKGKP